jgi:mediator of RNA polymerase II transcription subunit 16
MVQMGEDGKIKWTKLHYLHGDIGNSMQDGMSIHTYDYQHT